MEIVLDSPLDMHVHFRQGDMLKLVAPYTADHFSGALVMPNTVPPTVEADFIRIYKDEILEATKDYKTFEPYMTAYFQLRGRKYWESVKPLILAAKMYPKGVTTNSADGVVPQNPHVGDSLAYLEELEIPLCVHAETNDFVMDRESKFMPHIIRWAERYPKLKIIIEHVTDEPTLKIIHTYDNVFGTITVHHLLLTLDDVVGGKMQPHLFCKPIPKEPGDRYALIEAAIGSPRMMLGTDSAPHPISAKECCGCAAGIFTAPIALALLADIFGPGNNNMLQDFVSTNAREIYGISPPSKKVRIECQPTKIPLCCSSSDELLNDKTVALMWAGEEIDWRVTWVGK